MGKLLAEHQFVIFFQKSECHRMHTDLHRQFFDFAEVRDITFHGKDPYEETKKRFRAQMLKYENEKLETKFKFAGKKTDDDDALCMHHGRFIGPHESRLENTGYQIRTCEYGTVFYPSTVTSVGHTQILEYTQ